MPSRLKRLLLSSTIILVAAGCNTSTPQRNVPAAAPQTIQPNGVSSTGTNPQVPLPTQTPPIASPPTEAPATTTEPMGFTQTQASSSMPDYTPGYVIVSQTVDGSSQNQPYNKVKDSTNAFDLLNSTHTVTAKDYGPGMGEFVQSIDGIMPDSKHYWEFFVNGKSSNVGASSYILKDGDTVEWKIAIPDGSD